MELTAQELQAGISGSLLRQDAPRHGIGEQSEKTLHARLKAAYGPDPATREIRIGKQIADVFDGEEIVEIQTGSFRNLRSKLPAFLAIAPVRIIYPLTGNRTLFWIDPDTGEQSAPRNCGCRTKPIAALHELYAIREWLTDPRLRVELQLYDLVEYRLRCGYANDGKKGSRRIERIPTALRERIPLYTPDDYAALLPEALLAKLGDRPFTVATLSALLHIKGRKVYSILHVLEIVGLLTRISDESPARFRFTDR